jgi:hypothetical protein
MGTNTSAEEDTTNRVLSPQFIKDLQLPAFGRFSVLTCSYNGVQTLVFEKESSFDREAMAKIENLRMLYNRNLNDNFLKALDVQRDEAKVEVCNSRATELRELFSTSITNRLTSPWLPKLREEEIWVISSRSVKY